MLGPGFRTGAEDEVSGHQIATNLTPTCDSTLVRKHRWTPDRHDVISQYSLRLTSGVTGQTVPTDHFDVTSNLWASFTNLPRIPGQPGWVRTS